MLCGRCATWVGDMIPLTVGLNHVDRWHLPSCEPGDLITDRRLGNDDNDWNLADLRRKFNAASLHPSEPRSSFRGCTRDYKQFENEENNQKFWEFVEVFTIFF